MQLAERLRAEGARLQRVTALPYEPWIVLVPLQLVQWLLVAYFGHHAHHNGFVWSDSTASDAYVSPAHAIATGHVPDVRIGYGWPYILSPSSLIAGSSLKSVLPAVVLLQVFVLLPVALACVYRIAALIGGRLAGYWTAGLWVASPVLAVALFDPRLRPVLEQRVLPQTLGLTAVGSFPAMVALLVAAAFALQWVRSGAWLDAGTCGLAAGFAIALEPSSAVFLAGLVLVVVLALRVRDALPLAAGLALPLIALAVWRLRGTDHLPLAFWDLPGPSWSGLNENFIQLREYFFSIRLLEFLPIAGALAVARRSLPAAGLLGGWLTAYVLLRGGAPSAEFLSGNFFRVLMPAFPAYVLLTAAIPLLVPTLGTAVVERFSPRPEPWPARRKAFAAAAMLAGAVPIVLFAALPAG
jgi:hypothetical protein